MNDKRTEVLKSLEGFVGDQIPELTMKEDEYWQPSDYLPDMSQPNAMEQLEELHHGAL